jgi:hypothetical protein
MEALADSCRELETGLDKVTKHCQAITMAVDRFESHAKTYMIEKLSIRLTILHSWMLGVARSLYASHNDQGFVCVFLNNSQGLTLHWIEREEIISDREWFETHGSKVFSVEEASSTITGLLNELIAGNWVVVVEWLKQYGKPPGLDYNEMIKATKVT